jgi:hypothetical protein
MVKVEFEVFSTYQRGNIWHHSRRKSNVYEKFEPTLSFLVASLMRKKFDTIQNVLQTKMKINPINFEYS